MIPKFRAWDKTTSKLHVVNGIYCDNKKIHYIDDNRVRFVGFDNVIIMQSTGLFDKSGKEIYEGDVVQFEDCSEASHFLYINTGIVEWCQGGFHVTNRDSVSMEDLLDGDLLEVTIIGNIYENPELLEDKQ